MDASTEDGRIKNLENTISKVLDGQLQYLHQQLSKKDEQQIEYQRERSEIAIALTNEKLELSIMNEKVRSMEETIKRLDDSKKIQEHELKSLERQNEQKDKTIDRLTDDLNVAKQELEKAKEKVDHLTCVNTSFHSNIKVQKRVYEKLENELIGEETERRATEKQLEIIRRKLEASLEEKQELKSALENQLRDTDVVKASVKGLMGEIDKLREEKKKLEVQWEEAIVAMARRDQTLNSIHKSQEEYKSRNSELLAENKISKEEEQRYKADAATSTIKIKSLEKALMEAKSYSCKVEMHAKELESSMDVLRIADSDEKRIIEKLTKQVEILKQEIDRRESQIGNLKLKIEELCQHLLISEKERASLVNDSRFDDSSNAEQTKRKYLASEIRLRGELTSAKFNLSELQNQASSLNSINNTITTQYAKLERKSLESEEKIKRLEFELQRKEHDSNLWRLKYEESCNTNFQRQQESETNKYKKLLEGARIESDRLQRLWLNAQKDLLQAQKTNKTKSDEIADATTQGGMLTIQKELTEKALDSALKEKYNERGTVNKMWLELKRIKPLFEALQKKNTELEIDLAEKNAQLQCSALDAETGNNMLKAYIRQLKSEKVGYKSTNDLHENAYLALQRKYTFVCESLDQMKEENRILKRTNFELKAKIDSLQQKHESLKSKFRKWTDSTTRLMETQLHTEKSSTNFQKNHDTIDYKMDSLMKEKSYLQQENILFKEKIEVLKRKLHESDGRISRLTEHQSELRENLLKLKEEHRVVTNKYFNAEKIAFFLEVLYKETSPNVKIDYKSMLKMSENASYEVPHPSIQLLSALNSVQDPPK